MVCIQNTDIKYQVIFFSLIFMPQHQKHNCIWDGRIILNIFQTTSNLFMTLISVYGIPHGSQPLLKAKDEINRNKHRQQLRQSSPCQDCALVIQSPWTRADPILLDFMCLVLLQELHVIGVENAQICMQTKYKRILLFCMQPAYVQTKFCVCTCSIQ